MKRSRRVKPSVPFPLKPKEPGVQGPHPQGEHEYVAHDGGGGDEEGGAEDDEPRCSEGMRAEAAGHEPPSFSAWLLTLLAWSAVRDELRGDPLPADLASDFLRTFASRRTADPGAAERAMERLLSRLAAQFDLAPQRIAVLQAFGRFCLERLGSECGALDPGVPLDPRHVSCFLLRA